jgi:hypothetical protein
VQTQICNDQRHEIETKSRARLPPANKTVEFLVQEKSHFVETKHGENMPSIQRASLATSSRFPEFDSSELSESTFYRLLEFAHTSSYRFDIASFSSTRTSALILKPNSTSSSGKPDAPILAEISFLKLGTLRDFEACSSYAMKRLNAYTIMTEDTIAVFEEMYSDREPSKNLKEWTRQFLLAGPEDGSGGSWKCQIW